MRKVILGCVAAAAVALVAVSPAAARGGGGGGGGGGHGGGGGGGGHMGGGGGGRTSAAVASAAVAHTLAEAVAASAAVTISAAAGVLVLVDTTTTMTRMPTRTAMTVMSCESAPCGTARRPIETSSGATRIAKKDGDPRASMTPGIIRDVPARSALACRSGVGAFAASGWMRAGSV